MAATAVGHAVALLAGPPSPYEHIAQGPIADLALVLVAIAAWCAGARLLAAVSGHRTRQDWALPAFERLHALGVARLCAAIVPLQLTVLIAGESFEQHAAHVSGLGVASLFGSTLWWAPLIQFLVGAGAAMLTWRVSCA
ncbi:MAG TPA: hypothetical protein VEJ20_10075, partial [Candidatus Eremiobacteraceae bacterium]|nr:hypothetical protein [Candidatus Eremiobacteraceae bacterium]